MSKSYDIAARLAGRFLVMDGPDGAGKSTQLSLLAGRLKDAGVETIVTRDPGGTAIGDKIRHILLDKAHDEMAVRCELMLYMASRAQLAAQVIRPALSAGRCVLCDRWVSSTIAYQGAGGMSAEDVRAVAEVAVENLRPDLTIILDIASEAGLARAGRSGGHDRMESKALEFHRRVRELFLQQAAEDPTHFAVVDAAGTAEEVAERVWQAIQKLQ